MTTLVGIIEVENLDNAQELAEALRISVRWYRDAYGQLTDVSDEAAQLAILANSLSPDRLARFRSSLSYLHAIAA